jgi:spore coat protein U-like protein
MNLKTRASYFLSTIVAGILVVGQVSNAASPVTDNFDATINIVDTCIIVSAADLDFGTGIGILDTVIDSSADIVVHCTDQTNYDIGLNAGTGGGTIATRFMDSGTDTVSYQMFSDAGRTTNWGNTVLTDTVNDNGDGDEATHTIYGRVLVQTTPAADTYTDTVTVTVTY